MQAIMTHTKEDSYKNQQISIHHTKELYWQSYNSALSITKDYSCNVFK